MLAGAVALSVWTRQPARAIVQWAAGRALNAVVRIEGLTFLPVVRASRLYAYDSWAEARRNRPAIAIEGLEIAYRLRPPDKRYIPQFSAERLTLAFDGVDPEDRNYDFLTALLSQPASAIDPVPYLPQNLSIHNVDLMASAPEWNLSVAGIQIDMKVDGLDKASLRLRGDTVAGGGHWARAPSASTAFTDGTLDVTCIWEAGVLRLEPMRVLLPGAVETSGTLRMEREDRSAQFQLDMAESYVSGPFLAGFADVISLVPVSFTGVHFDDIRVVNVFEDGQMTHMDAAVQCVVRDSALVLDGVPSALGDVSVEGIWNGSGGRAAVTFPRRQAVLLTVEGAAPRTSRYAVAVEKWSRTDLDAVLPASWRERLLDLLPNLAGISSRASLDYTGTGRTAELVCAPEFADVRANPVLALKADWPPGAEAGFQVFPVEIKGSVSFAEATQKEPLTFTVEVLDPAPVCRGQSRFHAAQVSRFLAWFPKDILPEGWDARISGSIRAEGDASTAHIDASLEANQIILQGQPLPESEQAKLDAEVVLSDGYSVTSIRNARLRCGDWLDAAISDGRADTVPFSARGRARVAVDLSRLPPALNPNEWQGQLSCDLPVRYDKGVIETTFGLTGATLVMGPLASPPGRELSARGVVRYDTRIGAASFRDIEAKWGEETRLTADPFEYRRETGEARIPFTVHSDLTPLIDLGYLASVGSADAVVSGIFHMHQAGNQYQADIAASADAVTVRGEYAFLEGVRLEGKYSSDADPRGTASCDKIVGFGMPLGDVQGTWEIAGGSIRSEDLRGTLFGGRFRATAAQQLAGPPYSGQLRSALEQIDLARFTDEFQPKDIVLAGLANGDLVVEWDTDGMRQLRLHLLSDQGFSVNRGLLEWLLLSQYEMGEWAGKALKAIRDGALGTAAQRPFDSAELTLEWKDGEYVGEAALRSKGFNLTISPRIDGEVITNAMELRQQMRLEDIANALGRSVQ